MRDGENIKIPFNADYSQGYKRSKTIQEQEPEYQKGETQTNRQTHHVVGTAESYQANERKEVKPET